MNRLAASTHRRRLLVGAAAVLAVGAIAAGYVARGAAAGEEPSLADAGDTSGAAIGLDAKATTVAAPSIRIGEPIAAGRGGGAMPAPAADAFGCPAVLGGLLRGTTLDVAAGGFAPRLPASGFLLRSLSIHAEAPCSPSGLPAATGKTALETSWHHESSGLELSISQRGTDDLVANVLTGGSATFSDGGYTFVLNAYGFAGPVISGPAVDGGPDGPGSAPMPAQAAPEAKVAELLAETVRQLAPGLDMACFYREQHGGWESLSGLGIGDPRPAIPAGYSAESVVVRSFTPPAAGCVVAPLVGGGGFNASFLARDGDDVRGGIFVSANAFAEGGSMPGSIDEYSANWANGRWQFLIGAKAATPLGREAILALARALDLQFDASQLAERPRLPEPPPASPLPK